MTALAAPYAYFTQSTLWRKWVLFMASIPLAMLANTIRIVSIAVISDFFSAEFALGLYHDFSGYIVFITAVLLLTATGTILNINYKSKWNQWKNDLLSHSPPRQP